MLRAMVWLCLLPVFPAAAAETLRFHGFAYDLHDGRHLYTEVHEQVVEDGRWLRGRIDYLLPDGRRLGGKSLDFSADPYVPTYRLDLPLEGYAEAVTAVGPASLQVERRRAKDDAAVSRVLTREGPTCADSGLHAFLVAHFERLMQGEALNLRMVVAGSLDQFRFRARRVEDTRFEERPAVRFRVEPDSLLRYVIDPLELAYDPQTRMLLEYRGISNIRDPQTGRPYLTRVVYPSQPPPDAGKLPSLEP